MTEEEARLELKQELGHDPKPGYWKYLVKHDYVRDYLDGFSGLDTVVDEYRELESAGKEPRASAPEPRTSPPTPALTALSEVMAKEAHGHPLVVAFRERVLRGQVVDPVVGLKRFSDRLYWAVWMGGETGEWPPEWARTTVMDARRSGYTTTPDDDGDFLLCVIDALRETYGWPDPLEIAGFIFSGEAPALPAGAARVRLPDRFSAKTARVHLDVNLQMRPQDLVALYEELRRAIKKPRTRIRPPEEKACRLASWIARHNDRRSWVAARKAWNAEVPDDWKYEDTHADRAFPRDARGAYEKVTGEELAWLGGRQS
jgi:hypothetical protein